MNATRDDDDRNDDAVPAQPAGDADFDLLEAYLDGELTAAEVARLERRLRAEPELSDALGRMSAEFAVRRAVWQSMEPEPAHAAHVAAGVVSAARRADTRRRFARLSRLGGAVAACVALSFTAGWVGRGYAGHAVVDGAVSSHATSGPRPGTGGPNVADAFVYQVALTDEAGNITAVQKFERLEDAQSFAADVGRWQARQQQIADGLLPINSSGL